MAKEPEGGYPSNDLWVKVEGAGQHPPHLLFPLSCHSKIYFKMEAWMSVVGVSLADIPGQATMTKEELQ